MIKIAFRADGNEITGMGHVMRCLALAEELQKNAAQIMFLTRDNRQTISKIQDYGFQTVIIRSPGFAQEVEEIRSLIQNNSINLLITDSYKITEEYLGELKKTVPILVTVDDLNQMTFPSDIVINGNIYANELNYCSKNGNTRFLLGPSYVLMRREFSVVPQRLIRKRANKVLVTVGGSDGFNLTPKILNILDNLKQKLRITVVIGPNFLNTSEFRTATSRVYHEIFLKENVNNMKELMLECDLAITAGGTTLYELAVTGTPAVVILQAENQMLGAEKMHDNGIIYNLGMGNRDFSEPLIDAVTFLLNNYTLRKEMSSRGQKLIDGKGCIRCTREIVNTLKCKFP